MAVGDKKQDLQIVANAGILTIRPPAGEEWTIHNIYYTQGVTFRIANGANFLSYDSDSTTGARMNMFINLTNTQYLQVMNNYAGNNSIAYDGVQTK